MKKILMLLAVAMLMLGISGHAMAYFDDTQLIRVVYSKNAPNEFATSLSIGSNPFIAPTSDYTGAPVVFNSFNFNLDSFGAPTTWDQVWVGYYTKSLSNQDVWTSGPLTGQTSGQSKFGSFNSAANQVRDTFKPADTADGTVNGQTTSPKSSLTGYVYKMDAGGAAGSEGYFASFIPGLNGEINLAAFNNPNVQYIDQKLYFYNTPNTIQDGNDVAIIRTFRDGHTEILNPVPIPAAVYLLGSGLLGLIGIRRRMMR